MTKNRQSNIELLRLLAMFFIVVFHFIFYRTDELFENPNDSRSIALIFTIPFVFVSVNCYVLISGFFLIKCKLTSLFKYYLQCAFYSIIIYLIASQIAGDLSYKELLYRFLPFSHNNGLWFVPFYLTLFLLAPLLNLGVNNLGRKNYIFLLLSMTFLVVYMGYFNNRTDVITYTLLFIYLYLIGGFIKLYWSSIINKIPRIRYASLASYILFSLVQSFFFMIILYYKDVSKLAFLFRYDNPLIILSSISFFMFFLTFKFHSKLINWMASSSFAIYLIHENHYVRSYFHFYIIDIYTNINSDILFVVLFLTYSLLVCLFCIIIDKGRIVLTKPIEKFVFKYLPKF